MRRNGTALLAECFSSSDDFIFQLNENDGHKKDLPPQHIQCFACPQCFFLFTKRDECLQHMSGKKHFLQVYKLLGTLLLSVLCVLFIPCDNFSLQCEMI